MKQSKVIHINGTKATRENLVQFPKPKISKGKHILIFLWKVCKGLFLIALTFMRYVLLGAMLMLRKPVQYVFGFLASPILYLPLIIFSIWMEPKVRYTAWAYALVFFSLSLSILMLYEFILRKLSPESLVLN